MTTPLLVLYGSQTGNAQDVAERIGREALILEFAPRVLPMDAYPVTSLPNEHATVFVAATAGQGDPPDNMRSFWRFLLRKSLPPDSLRATSFAVFGLGDSGYPKYNVAAKKLDRRLQGLGATPLLEKGLGDDQHPSGYEAALDRWLPQLWAALRQRFPLPPGTPEPVLDDVARLRLAPPKFCVQLLPPGTAECDGAAGLSASARPQGGRPAAGAAQDLVAATAAAAAFRAVAAEAAGMAAAAAPGEAAAGSSPGGEAGPGPWRPFLAPVLANTRLTAPDHFQDTRHIELDLGGSGLEAYQPGDLLSVFPRPPADAVEAFLARMGWDGDARVRITAAPAAGGSAEAGARPAGQAAAQVVASLRAVAAGILDVAGAPPRRYLFQVLQHYVADNDGAAGASRAAADLQRERLAYFASAEGRDDLYRYNQRERRSLLEVLLDFPAVQPPLERLLEAAPLLQPRRFSLASAPAAHGATAHITVAIVAYKTPTQRPRRGLVTSWLAGVVPGSDCVPVWVETGALRMPASPAVPLLLVGPGTGVAPFRSFLWQRAALSGACTPGTPGAAAPGAVGAPHAPCVLFFGCRSSQADFYYRDEWRQLSAQRVLHPQHGLITAFSRQPPQLVAENGDRPEASRAGDGVAGERDGGARPDGGAATTGQKVYVTHRLREHGALVWRLLSEQGAWLYVSGSAQRMPADVAGALEDVSQVHGGLSREAAAKYVRQLELVGRYHVEAWS